MKRPAIFTLILLAMFFQSYAQSINVIGFKGGLNVSSIGSEGTGFTSKLGYNLGIYSASRMYQEFGIQLELLVSQQGARSNILSDLKLNYTYLTIPFLANVYFVESAAIESGLQIGYLLNATQVDSGDRYDIRDEVFNWDFSGVVGIKYDKSFGSLGLRYILGINNINNASQSAEVKYKNKVLQLYISKTLYQSK